MKNVIRVQGLNRDEGLSESCQVQKAVLNINPTEVWANHIRCSETLTRMPENKPVLFYSWAMGWWPETRSKSGGNRSQNVQTEGRGEDTFFNPWHPWRRVHGSRGQDRAVHSNWYTSRELQGFCLSHSTSVRSEACFKITTHGTNKNTCFKRKSK